MNRRPLDVFESLSSRLIGNDDVTSFRPQIYDCAVEADRKALEEFLGDQAPVIHDTLGDQLEEVLCSRNPGQDWNASERAVAVEAHLAGKRSAFYGRWVYYPWSKKLVHVLPPDEYFFLRSDRNRYKISPLDQHRLRELTIGVVGLSVGQASAITLAMEGVGGRFRLTDLDVLSVSNMNRLRAGIHDVAVKKTVLAARAMFEIDPYLDIQIFSEGLNGDNLESFFLEGGKLDLVVEECDDLFAKIRIREQAKLLRVPVIMETSDRGLIDVERFDLDPTRPILHGLLGEIRAASLAGLSTKDKVPYVLRILDENRISDAFAASLVEVKESIYTWPQLASGVALGGALVTDISRRLLLGEFTESGRYYVDIESIVCNGKAVPLAPAVLPVTTSETPTEQLAPPSKSRKGALSEEEARFLVSNAVLAPSGGNQQPWRFEFHGNRCLVFVDSSRSGSFLDYDNYASILATGAATENIVRAAGAIGLRANVTPLPEPDSQLLVASVDFERSVATEDPSVLSLLRNRVSNRRLGRRQPLSVHDARALMAASESAGAHLQLVTEEAALRQMARILGRCDRLRFLSQDMHRELMSELRWPERDAANMRTGIDLASLELSPADEAAMRILSRWSTMDRVRSFGGGNALEIPARKMLSASSAVGLLSIARGGRQAYFEGGRALQTVWLEATKCGIAFQPYSSLVYLLARLEAGGGLGLDDDENKSLRRLRDELTTVFPHDTQRTELLLFRLSYADPPTSRALRLPVDQVFSIL